MSYGDDVPEEVIEDISLDEGGDGEEQYDEDWADFLCDLEEDED